MGQIARRNALALMIAAGACGGAAAAQSRTPREWLQLPAPRTIGEVAPGVMATNDPDVFVARNWQGARPGQADGAEPACPEIPLRYWTGAPTTACQCFGIGEEAGVVFQPPASHYPLDVLRVNIAWGSAGECDPIAVELQGAINLYRAGLPNPGFVPDRSLEAPGMICGAFNSFDLTALGGQPFRVNSGKFTVTMEFDPATNVQPYPGTVVHDGNGCTAGKNVVKIVPGFVWFDACQLGVSGDWAIEIVYRRVSCPCPGDINGDHMVDFFDLNAVLSQYGQVGPNLTSDVNGDGRVDFVDLNIVLGAFGQPC